MHFIKKKNHLKKKKKEKKFFALWFIILVIKVLFPKRFSILIPTIVSEPSRNNGSAKWTV